MTNPENIIARLEEIPLPKSPPFSRALLQKYRDEGQNPDRQMAIEDEIGKHLQRTKAGMFSDRVQEVLGKSIPLSEQESTQAA